MKKDLEWLKGKLIKERDKSLVHEPMYHFVDGIIADINKVVIDQAEQPELPVIPDYIGKFIVFCKEWGVPLVKVMFDTVEMVEHMGDMAGKIEKWVIENSEEFALAYVLGYTIEDGKKKVKIDMVDLFDQIEKKLCLEYLKPVEFTRGERFGQHGYIKEITKEIEDDMSIELFVEEVTDET